MASTGWVLSDCTVMNIGRVIMISTLFVVNDDLRSQSVLYSSRKTHLQRYMLSAKKSKQSNEQVSAAEFEPMFHDDSGSVSLDVQMFFCN